MLYIAFVTDATPSGAPPGSIRVRVPELYGAAEYPRDVPPMFGGHAVFAALPSAKTPEGTAGRVVVARLPSGDLRWIGTDQVWSWVTDGAGNRTGVRSPDGSRWIKIEDGGSIRIELDGSSFMDLSADEIRLQSGDGSKLVMSSEPVFFQSAAAAASQVIHEGTASPGFSARAALAIGELAAFAAAFGAPTTNCVAMVTELGAGAYKATLKAE